MGFSRFLWLVASLIHWACSFNGLRIIWKTLTTAGLSSFFLTADAYVGPCLGALHLWYFHRESLGSDVTARMVQAILHHWGCGLAGLATILVWIDPFRVWPAPRPLKDHKKGTLQPRLFPCRTSHARMFPTPHSFSYSYLYVGIPIGWVGSANNVLSSHTSGRDEDSTAIDPRPAWFSVRSEDHLGRLNSRLSLKAKLREFLTKLGVEPLSFDDVYLVTAPRFLGFSFNPVSFWYLYSAEKTLTAMILEVNNTFDERRMYFLEKKSTALGEDSAGDIFACVWDKDFHVSPFNDRGGHYSLKAKDPFAPGFSGAGNIDNVITLMSPDGTPKIVAGVYSTGDSILAMAMGRLKTALFICRWWWVGFWTNVRILKEARKLWTKGLQVFYRPEVFRTSIGRSATADEDFLAERFMFFLLYIQKHTSDNSVSIHYTAAAGKCRGQSYTLSPKGTMSLHKNGDTQAVSDQSDVITLHILTPALYSNFFRFSDPVLAFEELCQCPVESERLGVLMGHSLLMDHIREAQMTSVNGPKKMDVDQLAYKIRLSYLRQKSVSLFIALNFGPTFLSLNRLPPRNSTSHAHKGALIDEFVFNVVRAKQTDRRHYQIVSHLLLCDRIAFGSVSVLRTYGYVIRYGLLWYLLFHVFFVIDKVYQTLTRFSTRQP